MSNFDCLYLYYISRHTFHFLTWFVFKLFCFGNVFIVQKRNLMLLFVQLGKSPGKVLEFESIYLVGTMSHR